MRYDGTYNSEFEEYYQNNVDPTARPLAINVDYSYALTKCYHELTDVLSGKKEPEDLDLLEYSYYRSCKAYLDNTDSATPEEWAAYTSRITACSLLANAKTNKVESLYFDETETMGTQWWKLRQMEKEYYLQIVTGERDIDGILMNLSPNGMKMEARLSRRKSGRLYVNRYPGKANLLCWLFFCRWYAIIIKAGISKNMAWCITHKMSVRSGLW